MTEEQIHQVLDPLEESVGSAGIGLRNVDRRLKLYYGERFGVEIKSAVGEGTTITIHLPACTAPPQPISTDIHSEPPFFH